MPLFGVALVLVAWGVGYKYTRYVPPPAEVWEKARELLRDPSTYGHLRVSFERLAAGLGIGYGVAFLVTMLMRLSRWWESFFSVYVFASLTIPSLAIALFSLMIFGLAEVGVYVSVAVIVFPFVVVSLNDGFKSLDRRLAEMANVYRLDWLQRVRHVAIPEMSPHLFAAFRNAHALSWKILVITEVFSQQDGIGFQYKAAFDNFQLGELVVWLFLFLIVVFSVEYGLLRPLERRVFRWRAASVGRLNPTRVKLRS